MRLFSRTPQGVALDHGNHARRLKAAVAQALVLGVMLAPELAHAQAMGGLFAGITEFFRELVRVLILEWGFYLGILGLAIQGFRAKMGHISWGSFGGWFVGISVVFFAPAIVTYIRDRAAIAI